MVKTRALLTGQRTHAAKWSAKGSTQAVQYKLDARVWCAWAGLGNTYSTEERQLARKHTCRAVGLV